MDHRLLRVELNDGHFIPVLGFGTSVPSKVPKSKVTEATRLAIDAGFRHIDSAYLYQNEEEVGLAIRSKIADGTVKREDIFYTSKLWPTFSKPELVQPALEMSLKKLQLDFVDLYLIHFPTPLQPGEKVIPQDEHGKLLYDTVDLCDTWAAMEKCKDLGLAKSIGVSNFNRRQMEKILNKPGLKYKPVCNQVECHPYLNQSQLLAYCRSKDIVLVAYCALGTARDEQWVDPSSPVLLEDPVLCAVAKKYQRSPAQIALRYQLQRGVVVLAQSFNEKRIKENMQVTRPCGPRGSYTAPSAFALLCELLAMLCLREICCEILQIYFTEGNFYQLCPSTVAARKATGTGGIRTEEKTEKWASASSLQWSK